MNCPSCNGVYEKKKLARHLLGKSCVNCEGVTFTLNDYLIYLSRSEPLEDSIEEMTDGSFLVDDTKKAMLCGCGAIMHKCRIRYETDRRIDYCSTCQTVWLDAGEWEYLKENNLHRLINKLFTEPYQRKLRVEKTRTVLSEKYTDQLGEEEYKQLKEVRDWVYNNENKELLLAYLNAKNPYSVLQ